MMTQIGVRDTMQRVVRYGCSIFLPVLLGVHAARRWLMTPKLSYAAEGLVDITGAKGG